DRARQADALRAGRSGREYERGARRDEVLPVVLAETVEVEADLIGQLDLFQDLLHPLLGAEQVTGVRVGDALRERVDAEFHDDAPIRSEPERDLRLPYQVQPEMHLRYFRTFDRLQM